MSPLSSQPSFNFSITSRSVQVSIVEEYHLQMEGIEQLIEGQGKSPKRHKITARPQNCRPTFCKRDFKRANFLISSSVGLHQALQHQGIVLTELSRLYAIQLFLSRRT